MADKKIITYTSPGEKVLVSKEIYDAITQMDRQERTQSDKDKRNKLLRYEELTTDSVFGEELIYDFMQDSVEDISLSLIMCTELHKCIALLPKAEQEIITGIYFQGYTERQLAKIGVPHMTVHCRKVRAMTKLKKTFRKLKKFRANTHLTRL